MRVEIYRKKIALSFEISLQQPSWDALVAEAAIKEGLTPLHYAAQYTHLKDASILIERAPEEKINIQDGQGCTPLFRALLSYMRNNKPNANYDIVRQLLAKGADPTIPTLKDGQTPISLLDKKNGAVPNEVKTLILYYLIHHFDKYQADKNTKLEFLRFLIRNGADYMAEIDGKIILNTLTPRTAEGVEDVINEFISEMENINQPNDPARDFDKKSCSIM